MEYLSLRQTAEKWGFRFVECKLYAVQIGYRELLRLVPIGQFR